MMLLWVEGFKKLLLSCSNRFKEVVKQEGGELIYSSSLWPFSIVYTVNLDSLSLSAKEGSCNLCGVREGVKRGKRRGEPRGREV